MHTRTCLSDNDVSSGQSKELPTNNNLNSRSAHDPNLNKRVIFNSYSSVKIDLL